MRFTGLILLLYLNVLGPIMAMKLFDAHCHLQDPRIIDKAPQLIANALNVGVHYFAANGISEKDWHLVKEMADEYPSVIPCFGLHPWFIADRTPNWLNKLREFFDANPSAAVGEIGLDKGPLAKNISFTDQVEVFEHQLRLAKYLNKPVTVHCVDAFDELLQIMRNVGPFPAGVILHSYIGSAEIVPELAKLGSYFSFSGWFMPIEKQKAKRTLKAVPTDRILLETDSPDGLPLAKKGTLNQPANILLVLDYVASLLDVPKEEVARHSYKNAVRLFSYQGSKILKEEC